MPRRPDEGPVADDRARPPPRGRRPPRPGTGPRPRRQGPDGRRDVRCRRVPGGCPRNPDLEACDALVVDFAGTPPGARPSSRWSRESSPRRWPHRPDPTPTRASPRDDPSTSKRRRKKARRTPSPPGRHARSNRGRILARGGPRVKEITSGAARRGNACSRSGPPGSWHSRRGGTSRAGRGEMFACGADGKSPPPFLLRCQLQPRGDEPGRVTGQVDGLIEQGRGGWPPPGQRPQRLCFALLVPGRGRVDPIAEPGMVPRPPRTIRGGRRQRAMVARGAGHRFRRRKPTPSRGGREPCGFAATAWNTTT